MSDTAIFGFGGLALALAAAVVAIWQGYLLRKELQHSQRSTDADLHFRVHNAMQELNKFFVDRPELRPYFYENKRLPRSKRELDRLDATAEMLLDIAESIVATGHGLGAISLGWNKYFAFLYKNSEALRKHWRENWDYYPDSVREAFQASSPGYQATPSGTGIPLVSGNDSGLNPLCVRTPTDPPGPGKSKAEESSYSISVSPDELIQRTAPQVPPPA
jgi:hypothetical protein